VSRQGMSTASAHCYAAEGRLPYAPVTAWLRSDAVQADLHTLDDVWLSEVARLLPELLIRRTTLTQPLAMTEGWQRQRFFEALARALLTARQPLLLMLDDLQWCDSETLEWLHYLLRFVPQARLLLMGTVRSEETPPDHPLMAFLNTLQRDRLITELTLGPLDTAETASLAEHIAGRQLDTATVDRLQHETEGNPLFVVEMIRAGALEQDEREQNHAGGVLLTQSASTLPPAIHTVLAARLAQLSPFARELANLAAVIGRAFSFTVLARASGEHEEKLVGGLDELWQKRIIRGQDAENIEMYDFCHDKLREEAYTSLSSIRRRYLHRRVAKALEEIYVHNLDTVSNQIAAHYESAGLSVLAIPYYQRAGEAAQRIYAHEEAIAALRRAITLLTTLGQARYELPQHMLPGLYERLGDSLEMIGKHREGTSAYEQALTAVSTQERIWQARLYRKIATTLDFPQTLREALHAYKEAERILEQVPGPSSWLLKAEQAGQEWRYEWIEIQVRQIHVFFLLAKVPEMTSILEKIEPLVEQYGTADQRVTLYTRISSMRNVIRDRYTVSEETLLYCRKALEASQESGNLRLIGTAQFGFGYCLLLAGDYDAAEEHLHAALAAGEQVGNVELIARCRLYFLPLLWRKRGQVEKVRECTTRAIEQGEARYINISTANHAWVAWRDGDKEQAEKFARKALQIQQDAPYVFPFLWLSLWPLIGVELTKGNLADAVDHVRMLLAPTQQRPPEALQSLLEAAVHAWENEQPADKKLERTGSLLQQALPLAEREGYL
ncbi:MAG TPA: AAA family ATPase, partial [Ktedonobacteraceae bacterium]|nr:AAA family ATPase [Ktedonobacteraceae bacterium]